MKSLLNVFLALTALLTLAATPAQAQWGTGTTSNDFRPMATSAQDIAFAYHYLIGKGPDVREMALYSDEYKNATDFDRELVRDEKARQLRSQFQLYNKPQPIVIDTMAYISEYSADRKGYVITSFSEQTMFKYNFGGKDYAIVLPNLGDYQWIAVEGDIVKSRIEPARAHNKNQMNFLIEITPTYGDQRPLTLEGKEYSILSGDIRNIMMYAPKTRRPLWARDGRVVQDASHKELMNLFPGGTK